MALPAATLATDRGRYRVGFTAADGPLLWLTLRCSRLPDLLDRPRRNIVAITLGTSAHLAPELADWTPWDLGHLLAHEWRHRWQRERYGLAYAPMAVWRVLTDGYADSDMEHDADAFETAYGFWFLDAAEQLLASRFFGGEGVRRAA
jgi:hypothetical protein